MQLPEIAIRRPVFATVLSLLVLLVGAVSFTRLAVREYPKIDEPVVTVSVRYPGASAEVIETQVTKPLEDSIAGIDAVDVITSISRAEQSQISVRFRLEKDADAAAAEVRDRTSRVRNKLPQSIDEPVIAKVEADAFPVIWLAFTSDTLSPLQINDLVNRIVKSRLQTVTGVADVRIYGERKYAMRVWLDPDRLAGYRLTTQDVEDAITRSNLELPAGRIESQQREFSVTSQTDLVRPAQFGEIVIKSVNGFPVKIRDVAQVEEGAADERSSVRLNGRQAISAGVIRQATANPLTLSQGVRDMIPKLKADLPADITIDIANDNSVFIDRSVKNVYHTIGEAILLVALVIFVFLRTIRASIIPIVTIPVSLIGAFALMALFGFTINTLTLLALVLAIGLVVDDAIVMLENIFRHIEEGMDPFSASIKGAREIGFAVITMTLTLVAVYAPLAFTPGRTGRLFVEFALALAGAVLVSGFIALTLTPMMCSKLLRHNPNPNWFDRSMERWLTRLSEGYARVLRWVLLRRWHPGGVASGTGLLGLLFQARAIVIGVMLLSALGIAAIWPTMKQELSPLEDRGTILATVNAPDGSTLEYTDRYAKALEKLGQQYPEFDRIFGNVGNPTVSQASVVYRTVDWDDRKRTTLQLAREMAPKFNAFPGVNAFPITPPSLGQGFRERPLNFVIQTSDSYENLNRVTRQMLDEIAKNPGIVSPDVDLRLNKPELRIEVDRAKAADMGVSVQVVAKALETMLGGRQVTRYKRDAEQYDVIVQTRPSGRSTPEDIASINVRGRGDTMIPLSALIKARESVSPRELNHFGQRRSVSITANLSPDYSLGAGADLHERHGGQGPSARLHHRAERHFARIPQLARRAGDRVRAGAAVHLPGAGGAVRELHRPAGDHGVGAAVDDRSLDRAQVVGWLAQRVFADRPDHAGRADHQARHPDRGIHQPAAPAGPGSGGRAGQGRLAAAAPYPDDHRRHGPGCGPAGDGNRRGRRKPNPDRLGDRGRHVAGHFVDGVRRTDDVHGVRARQGAGRQHRPNPRPAPARP